VGIFGELGRGVEEVENVKADVVVGTFGKAFGSDGGYVVANQTIIDYLRESSATYIYSNSISPGTAGSAKSAVEIVASQKGKLLIATSKKNIFYFKGAMLKENFTFAADSDHPIQPVLIGDTAKTKHYVEELFALGFLTTNISFPVVPMGRDEIRVQISATHTHKDIDALVEAFVKARKKIRLEI
jgi:glycine C-acetyltransferase